MLRSVQLMSTIFGQVLCMQKISFEELYTTIFIHLCGWELYRD